MGTTEGKILIIDTVSKAALKIIKFDINFRFCNKVLGPGKAYSKTPEDLKPDLWLKSY